MPGPLSGIKVLDFTWALAGPYGVMILADLGAEVWKIETAHQNETRRGSGPYVHGVSTYFFSVNRGKKSIMLDLKVPEARRAEVKALIALVNEQLWIGHFDIWNHEGVILFRNSHLLTGGAEVSPQQCEALLRSATESCDLYYQAFQFVVWAGKPAAEALESVLFETVGEA